MKKLVFVLPAIIFLSCTKISGPKQEDLALQSAKAYYDQLLHGNYNAFVEGSLHGDTLPKDYKEQLLVNAQMFLEQQQEAHQGIDHIDASRAICDSVQEENGSMKVTADAFLTMYFKDKTKEEISVPMVRKNNIWYLK